MNIYQILETLKNVEESTMTDAEQHSTGPKFVGKMKGTDPASARYSKLVGECDEPMSLTDKLKARWEQTKREKGIAEAGANNPAQGTQNVSPADLAKAAQTSQQNLTTLKSQAGVVTPAGVNQAAQSAAKTATNPTAIPTSQDKKVSGALGQELEQLIANAEPSKFNQIANAIKQVKQGTQ